MTTENNNTEGVGESTALQLLTYRVDELVRRVDSLEDDKKWLVRLVGAFIIMGILGAVFVTKSVGAK